MSIFKQTKIVCTLGPSSNNYETILAMANAGMNVVRLNFSPFPQKPQPLKIFHFYQTINRHSY